MIELLDNQHMLTFLIVHRPQTHLTTLVSILAELNKLANQILVKSNSWFQSKRSSILNVTRIL